MRYRQLDPNGDYTISLPVLVNSPQCVAQAIETRLGLFLGEWFVDVTDGTPWLQQIMKRQFGADPNTPIKQRILGTPNVNSLLSYSSTLAARQISVTGSVNTPFGVALFSAALALQ